MRRKVEMTLERYASENDEYEALGVGWLIAMHAGLIADPQSRHLKLFRPLRLADASSDSRQPPIDKA